MNKLRWVLTDWYLAQRLEKMRLQKRNLPTGEVGGPTTHVSTKSLPESIRPRERLAAVGAENMSDSELMAIILGTGRRGLNSIRMAETLLSTFNGIGRLSGAGFDEIAGVKGVGPAKAAQVMAAVELGKRIGSAAGSKRVSITSPKKVAEMLLPKMRYLEKEHFKALILNTKNQLIKTVDIAVGTLSSAIIHPRELYKTAIRASGAGLIVAHNHPSGDVNPSREDVILTKRLAEAGRILGIDFLDHIIIGDGCWLSLKEKGYFST